MVEATLTGRELEVLAALRSGARSLGQIALALQPPVSPRTAEVHVSNIAAKLPAAYETGAPPFWRVVLWAQREASTGSTQ